MTYEFEYLMHLLAAASRGTQPEPPKAPLSWEQVFNLAHEQQISPLILLACKDYSRLGCPVEISHDRTGRALRTALSYCARIGFIASLLDDMEQAGIHAFMVKGMVAAANYAYPERRISSDADICINPADETRACEWLETRGFTISPRWLNGHHAVAKHSRIGVIEVHIRLYDEMPEEVWFKNVDPAKLIMEPQKKITTKDGSYYTLGDTDHLIFMTLHMIKHFISCGMSLRMMMDVALQFSKHKDTIDAERFWSVMGSLSYTSLVNSVLWAMIRYCGFTQEDFPGLGPCQEEHVLQILNDIETGGWLGKNNKSEREKSGLAYNQELMLRQLSPWRYKLYMFKWRHGLNLRTFFPKRKQLTSRYPWLDRMPWLLPAAWFHRLVFSGGSALKKENAADRSIQKDSDYQSISHQRLEMFRSLDML